MRLFLTASQAGERERYESPRCKRIYLDLYTSSRFTPPTPRHFLVPILAPSYNA
jgi:hypothetical protein